MICGNAAAVDLESWNEGFDELQTAITSISNRPGSIAILSGDVHYSFMRKGEFKTSPDNAISVYQMTSSPLHNQPPKLQFSHRDVLVQKGEFIESEGKSLGKSTTIISINNLAMVSFDPNGKTIGQTLITNLPDGQKQYTTFKV